MALRKGTAKVHNAIILYMDDGSLDDVRVTVTIPVEDDTDPANIRAVTEVTRTNVSVMSKLTAAQKTNLETLATRLATLGRAAEL